MRKLKKVIQKVFNKKPDFIHIHHTSSVFFSNFKETYSPVFFLNTGRSGSAFIKSIFDNFSEVEAHHEANPNLLLFPNFAFNNQDKKDILKYVFEAARTESLLNAKVLGKVYLESNQCLVFFINQIKAIYPNAKFIHLIRHPGDFVCSAMKKGWHKNDSIWEIGRIKMDDDLLWNELSQIEKLSWVWNETHMFIEKFKNKNKNSFYTVRLEDLVSSSDELIELINFIGLENNMSNEEIKELLSKKVNEVLISRKEPPNMYKLEFYPRYEDWNNENKDLLKDYVQDLSEKYNYKL